MLLLTMNSIVCVKQVLHEMMHTSRSNACMCVAKKQQKPPTKNEIRFRPKCLQVPEAKAPNVCYRKCVRGDWSHFWDVSASVKMVNKYRMLGGPRSTGKSFRVVSCVRTVCLYIIRAKKCWRAIACTLFLFGPGRFSPRPPIS